jgi:hypothetical protein
LRRIKSGNCERERRDYFFSFYVKGLMELETGMEEEVVAAYGNFL